jgi:hypothetical protein
MIVSKHVVNIYLMQSSNQNLPLGYSTVIVTELLEKKIPLSQLHCQFQIRLTLYFMVNVRKYMFYSFTLVFVLVNLAHLKIRNNLKIMLK